MSTQTTSFLLAVALGAFSSVLGFALYRYGKAYVKYRGARFGGAVAIAGAAFYLMSGFYFRQMDREVKARESVLAALREAIAEYDQCAAQQRNLLLTAGAHPQAGGTDLSCKFQADALRDAARPLLR